MMSRDNEYKTSAQNESDNNNNKTQPQLQEQDHTTNSHKLGVKSYIINDTEMKTNKTDDNHADDNTSNVDGDDKYKKVKPSIESTSDTSDPTLFWLAWSERKKACFNENGEHVLSCNCFEGIGSIM